MIQVESQFNATLEQVWNALTNIDAMKKWYFTISNFNLNIGNKFSFYETDGTNFLHECEVLQVEKEAIFQHTWTYPEKSKGSSVVTWKLTSVDENNTKVTLTHEGIESFNDGGPDFAVSNFEMGWNALIKTSLRNYLYGIEKLIFEQKINASANHIWDKLWDKNTYSQWTKPFCPGTYFTGEINLGDRIHFISPSGEGMYSDVFYLVPNKIVIFKHIGMLKDLKELPIDTEAEKWTGSFETYKLNEENSVTTVIVEVDCVPEYIDYMKSTFPLALQELKKISEN